MKYYEHSFPRDLKPDNLNSWECLVDGEWYESSDLESFESLACRWEVTEAQWRSRRIAEGAGIALPPGEVVSISVTSPYYDNFAMTQDSTFTEILAQNKDYVDKKTRGIVDIVTRFYTEYKKEDPWVTPTDEDARLRPKAQFSVDEEFKSPYQGTLMGVCQNYGQTRYMTALMVFAYCRVKQSELDRLRGDHA